MEKAEGRARGNGTLWLVTGVLFLVAAVLLTTLPLVRCPDILCRMAQSTPLLQPANDREGRSACPVCGGRAKVSILRWWRVKDDFQVIQQ